MKFAFALAGVVAWLGAALLLTAAGTRAQTTGSINPGTDRTDTPAKNEPPPGGCMPIGVTASGEIVFPFLCKGFIEQHKAANQQPATGDLAGKPAAVDGPPKSEDKRATTEPEEVAPKAAAPAAEVAKEGQGPSPAPAAADEPRPAGDDKPEHADETRADETRAAKPADTAAAAAASSTPEAAGPGLAQKREPRKPREGSAGPPGCTRFRSYDPGHGTYVDYSGRRQACRS
jgi:hypothetical protein